MKHCNQKENIPLYAISVIALASPLSGYIFRGLTSYSSYFIAAIILSAFLTVYAISSIFSKNERDAIIVSKMDILIGVYLLYNLLCIFVLHKISHEPLFYARWCLIVMLYITARLTTKANAVKLLYLLIIGGLIQAIIIFAQYSGIISSLNGSFNITGTFTNPGHVAVYLSGSIVSAIILFKQSCKTTEKPSKILLPIFIVILFAALCLCKSRTSFIALIAAVIVVLLQTDRFRHFTKVCKSAIVACSVILLLFMVAVSYNIRTKSADARMLIWRVSTELFMQSPVFGNGTESFKRQYMYRQAEYFSKATINAAPRHNLQTSTQFCTRFAVYFNASPNSKYILVANNHYQSFNEFIHIACEQGIIGLLLFLSIMGYALFKGKSLITKPLLIWLLVSSCFLYTADIFPIVILFPIILGISDNGCCACSGCKIRYIPYRAGRTVSAILLFGFLLYSCHYKQRYDSIQKELVHANSSDKTSMMALLQPSNYDIIRHNKDFSLLFAKMAFNNLEPKVATRVISDIAANRRATSTMICDLGDLYRKQKLYREAEKNYKLASDMVPCRIMPNYMLFKLYVEMKDYTSAYRMAEKILSQPVSITGSMALRIRNEVKVWMNDTSAISTSYLLLQ